MLECVVNVSEGRDRALIERLAQACEPGLLDIHSDPVHNRSVFTLVGVDAPRRLAAAAVGLLEIDEHDGVHPRLGIVDVVPFVALSPSTPADAVQARDDFAHWAATELGVPVFLYGPSVGSGERTLPELRRRAFTDLMPDAGPPAPHPRAGAMCVGARDFLVAYNVWLDPTTPPAMVKRIADAVRGDGIRTLPLIEHGPYGELVQISMNLIDCQRVGPAEAYDRVCEKANENGAIVQRAELVGLLPKDVLNRIPASRWNELDVSEDRTIEARLRTIRP